MQKLEINLASQLSQCRQFRQSRQISDQTHRQYKSARVMDLCGKYKSLSLEVVATVNTVNESPCKPLHQDNQYRPAGTITDRQHNMRVATDRDTLMTPMQPSVITVYAPRDTCNWLQLPTLAFCPTCCSNAPDLWGQTQSTALSQDSFGCYN
jgi:hypothetical protein